jgi:carbamate kinase
VLSTDTEPQRGSQQETQNEMVVLALGGNAIQQKGQRGTAAEQIENVSKAMQSVVELVSRGYRVVLTHGNGPQVGTILLQQAEAEATSGTPAMPMDVAGAMSQGQIGYMMQQSLGNELRKRGINLNVATIVTQMIVDPNDPAFDNPTKPIGPYYTAEKAAEIRKQGYTVSDDSGKGQRRMVPSPAPIAIEEIAAVRSLVESGTLVICSGGGGIPVVRDEAGLLHGVEAVIDKDMGASLLARELRADRLMILTDVEKAAINFRKPDQRELAGISVEEAKQYIAEGHFATGSMGPKVRAATSFVEAGGKQAIITHLRSAIDALEGKTGTSIRSSE